MRFAHIWNCLRYIMERSEQIHLKNASQEKLGREINAVDPPEVKTQPRKNSDEFNFSDFQFKPRKKKSSQVTNCNVPALPMAILECPLCGCRSKTDAAKVRHLKDCAKKRGISFAKMQEAVQLQKRQAEERRLAGLPIVPSKPTREPRRNVAIKRQLEPQTELQADLQMALAMSLSLQQKRDKEEDQERFFLEALTGESENEDNKLITALKFGSAIDEKLQAPPGRKNRKKQQSITPFWLVRSKEETKMIHAERVVKILSEQASDSDEENCPFILNWKKVRAHCTMPWPSSGYCRLWEAAMLSKEFRSDTNNFYVKTLEQWFPPKEELTPKNEKPQHSVSSQKNRKKEEIECLPSTLAALDALNANNSFIAKDVTVETGLDGFLLDNTYGDGFFTQVQKNERMHSGLSSQVVKQLLSMVNNDVLSDVEIIVKNDEVIPCHKFILYTSCPAAYQELVINSDPILLWPDISREGAIAFLQFIYGGVFTSSYNKEMRQLAIRYELQQLLNLISDAERSDCSEEDHNQFDEPLSAKFTGEIGSNSPESIDYFSSSPILKSNKQLSGRSSPVLASNNNNLRPAACKLAEGNRQKIINPVKYSGCFDASSKNARSPLRKLSHNGSSMMSPDLFSSVHGQEQKNISAAVGVQLQTGDHGNAKDILIDKPLEMHFATNCTFTPKTATSTPIENNIALSSKNAITFSISPVLAEQLVGLQSPHCLRPKHLLEDLKSGKTCSAKISASCVVADTPEMNSRDVCSRAKNGSMDNIYDLEESWEEFNFHSENERYKNGSQSDGGSKSSLESLVLESLRNVSNSEDKDAFSEHLPSSGKRKLALTSLTSRSSSKRMRHKSGLINDSQTPTTSRQAETMQNLDVEILQLSNDSLYNPESEMQDGNVILSPCLEQSLQLASTPISTKSMEHSFEHNNTWNDFPEGYYSDDNIHLLDDSMSNPKDHQQDIDYDNRSLTSSMRAQLRTSPIHSSASTVINPRFGTELPDTNNKCSEFVGEMPSFQSQASIWNDEMDEQFNNGEVHQSESDLPDINPYPVAHESVQLEEEYVSKCAPESVLRSSTPIKKIPATKKTKRSKKLPKEACVTPMPHYSIMETPLIKKELKKIGVRALPKKKGVMVLKHVYMETHPESPAHPSNGSPSLEGDPGSSISVADKGVSLDDSYNCISKVEVSNRKKTKLSTKSKKKTGTTEDAMESQQCKSQSSVKKASPRKGSPEKEGNKQALSSFLKEELKTFLFVNTELRTRIVNYQPIDFKSLYSDMKTAGLKPTVQELQDFLDDQCITYTSVDELSPRKSKTRTCRRGKKRQ